MKKYFAICALAAMVLASCTPKQAQEALIPESTGAPYDLYLVMPENLKETPLNDSLHAIFEYPMECTPNGDEYFYVSSILPDHFVRTVRTLANVVTVEVDPDYRGEPVKMSRDTYSRGQVIVKIKGQSIEHIIDVIMPMQGVLRDIFVKNEINRRKAQLLKDNAREQVDRLMKLQNVSMLIPYAIKKPGRSENDPKFFWVTDDYMDKQSHLVVYSIPYTDQNVFSLEGAVAVRDSVMKANIQGSDSTQYMETNKKVVLPEYKALNIGGKYVGELRGMWRMVNGLMAGPFVCHIRLDEVNKRVVFAEGFCYAPHDGKRKLIRNLEAAIYTLQLPSDNMMSEIEITLE